MKPLHALILATAALRKRITDPDRLRQFDFISRATVADTLRLGSHTSLAAYRETSSFLDSRPDYPPLLRNKILQAAYPLYRQYAPRQGLKTIP